MPNTTRTPVRLVLFHGVEQCSVSIYDETGTRLLWILHASTTSAALDDAGAYCQENNYYVVGIDS